MSFLEKLFLPWFGGKVRKKEWAKSLIMVLILLFVRKCSLYRNLTSDTWTHGRSVGLFQFKGIWAVSSQGISLSNTIQQSLSKRYIEEEQKGCWLWTGRETVEAWPKGRAFIEVPKHALWANGKLWCGWPEVLLGP